MLELVQIPIAWSLARRLRMRLRERELLLHRALEASDVERRQIASDLHDGAVQDLAGVAYALSAPARRDGAAGSSADTKVIEDAAESIRGSIRSLRSLIVDIYPPDFDEVSFDSAMTDLFRRGSDRGLRVDLEIDLDDPLPDSAARLLYRSAQEGLRNTLDHAEAPSVRRQRDADATAPRSLDLVDDGRGFDAARRPRAGRDGHFGLVALRGLVTDAGGRLDVRLGARRGNDPATWRCRYDHDPSRRVVIADDHAVVRGGLEQLLSTADDIELVGMAADGEEAVATVAR